MNLGFYTAVYSVHGGIMLWEVWQFSSWIQEIEVTDPFNKYRLFQFNYYEILYKIWKILQQAFYSGGYLAYVDIETAKQLETRCTFLQSMILWGNVRS